MKLIIWAKIKKIKSKRQFLRKKQKLYLKIFHFKSYFPWHLLCDRYFYHDFSLSDFILDEFSPNRRHVSIANICTQPPFVQWNDFCKCIFCAIWLWRWVLSTKSIKYTIVAPYCHAHGSLLFLIYFQFVF